MLHTFFIIGGCGSATDLKKKKINCHFRNKFCRRNSNQARDHFFLHKTKQSVKTNKMFELPAILALHSRIVIWQCSTALCRLHSCAHKSIMSHRRCLQHKPAIKCPLECNKFFFYTQFSFHTKFSFVKFLRLQRNDSIHCRLTCSAVTLMLSVQLFLLIEKSETQSFFFSLNTVCDGFTSGAHAFLLPISLTLKQATNKKKNVNLCKLFSILSETEYSVFNDFSFLRNNQFASKLKK